MARYEIGSTTRRVELTPLIDVIFLLLIFFLVTLNIIPILGGQGKQEVAYPVRALDTIDPTRSTLVVMTYPVGSAGSVYLSIPASCADDGVGNVDKFRGVLTTFLADGQLSRPEVNILSRSFGAFVYYSPAGLGQIVNPGVMTDAVIFCDPKLEFGHVSEIISVLQGRGLAVKIVPMSLRQVPAHWRTVVEGVQHIYRD